MNNVTNINIPAANLIGQQQSPLPGTSMPTDNAPQGEETNISHENVGPEMVMDDKREAANTDIDMPTSEITQGEAANTNIDMPTSEVTQGEGANTNIDMPTSEVTQGEGTNAPQATMAMELDSPSNPTEDLDLSPQALVDEDTLEDIMRAQFEQYRTSIEKDLEAIKNMVDASGDEQDASGEEQDSDSESGEEEKADEQKEAGGDQGEVEVSKEATQHRHPKKLSDIGEVFH
jgi:hypothetical protein